MSLDNNWYSWNFERYHIFISYSIGRKEGRKGGNALFNDTLNTFYLRLYGVRHYGKGPFR